MLSSVFKSKRKKKCALSLLVDSKSSPRNFKPVRWSKSTKDLTKYCLTNCLLSNDNCFCLIYYIFV